jgi:hypothetical protein
MGKGLYGWICGATAGAVATNVKANYLPGSCRGT